MSHLLILHLQCQWVPQFLYPSCSQTFPLHTAQKPLLENRPTNESYSKKKQSKWFICCENATVYILTINLLTFLSYLTGYINMHSCSCCKLTALSQCWTEMMYFSFKTTLFFFQCLPWEELLTFPAIFAIFINCNITQANTYWTSAVWSRSEREDQILFWWWHDFHSHSNLKPTLLKKIKVPIEDVWKNMGNHIVHGPHWLP